MLQVDKLHQYYGGSHILRGLSFDVKVGEVTCLLGRNGVGKTTLLKCLMGLLPAKEGAVNTPEAIHNLELAYLIGPVVFVMLGGACMIGYALDAKRHGEIRRQLDERDALYDETPIIEVVSAEAAIAVPPQAGR